jgi:amidase
MPAVTGATLIRLSASELQELLKAGQLTSVDLIKASLAQIERHNYAGLNLRAIISVAPERIAIEAAAKLDRERKEGKIRGPLHGLPLLVKVGATVSAETKDIDPHYRIRT